MRTSGLFLFNPIKGARNRFQPALIFLIPFLGRHLGIPFFVFAPVGAQVVDVLGRHAELEAAVALLDERGVRHGGLKDIGAGFILEFRDPDNIALELFAPKGKVAAS